MDVTVNRKLGCNGTPTDRKGKEVDGSLLRLDRVLVGNRTLSYPGYEIPAYD
jgi:hypothetical protein